MTGISSGIEKVAPVPALSLPDQAIAFEISFMLAMFARYANAWAKIKLISWIGFHIEFGVVVVAPEKQAR